MKKGEENKDPLSKAGNPGAESSPTGSPEKTGEKTAPSKETTGYVVLAALLIYLGWGLINTDGNLILILSGPITSTLHLSLQQYSYVISGGFFASFVVSLILGPLGDRLGRRFILQFTLVGTAFFSMLQYFINGFLSWFGIRLAAGAFTGGEWGAGSTLLSEVVGKRLRGLALSIMQSGWVFGYGLASAIALFTISTFGPTYGWRVAFLFAFLPALLVLLLRGLKLKDSTRFEHLKAVREAKKRGDTETLNRLLQQYSVNVNQLGRGQYGQLLAKDLRRTTLVLAFWNFLTTGIAITANSFQPIYFQDVKGFPYVELATMFTVVSFAGIIGYIINGVLNDWIGAKYSIIIFALIESIGIYLLTFDVAHSLLTLYAYYILFFFTENGQFSALVRLNSEAFPTRVRATGAIWGGAFWSLGQAVWPLLFAALIPALSFNGAWLWVEVVPELLGLVILGVVMKNIPPRKELEEIAI
ncbi:MFS transporter [Sulfodiicoccus acidiphilus]|uniref:MFS transporter n=1 Tax=Sulfodiicoccus acidiphilus TaxID=1670455 RepID=A0A348B1H3_9CREN|nr:MFS transporter [Sulfodiicoccus acidiphilus]BBD72025.1 MFS transporter [Sulfodiicoccus acidiphilus]GGU00317.1 MFS transporter [Sulfodiicoccus acidiphilus]